MGMGERYGAPMKIRVFFATLLLSCASLGTSLAATNADPPWMATLNAQVHAATLGPASPCRSNVALRNGMYAAQAADAFATGAAVKHGAIGRTPFGTTDAFTSLATQALFDIIVDRLTTHASCGTKNLLHAAIGGSAVFNAFAAGKPQ